MSPYQVWYSLRVGSNKKIYLFIEVSCRLLRVNLIIEIGTSAIWNADTQMMNKDTASCTNMVKLKHSSIRFLRVSICWWCTIQDTSLWRVTAFCVFFIFISSDVSWKKYLLSVIVNPWYTPFLLSFTPEVPLYRLCQESGHNNNSIICTATFSSKIIFQGSYTNIRWYLLGRYLTLYISIYL